ncbi:MAG: ribosomal protein S18-alanine N-acetyltransferase [Candidatus Caenarcaniphilales bacterium]|nr:ribosomal protein S18-alanine N-acetyltransferase [Candidatus Caenarcaniphilales bacterium]
MSELIQQKIKIHSMLLADLESVCAIEFSAHGQNSWTRQTFINELNNSLSYYWIAQNISKDTDSGQIVAFTGCHVIGEECFITNLAVEPGFQRRKIGQALLMHLIKQVSKLGVKYLTLEVRAGNIKAQNLYKKFGFEEKGLRPNYYPDNHENALIMWTSNIQSVEYKLMLEALATTYSNDADKRSDEYQNFLY